MIKWIALALGAIVAAELVAAPNPPGRARRARRASWDVYSRWRDESPLGFRGAYVECFRDSLDAAARHDYSKPADRRCILGKMHAHKRTAWLACRRGCRGELGDDGVEVFEDVAGTAYSRRGEPDTYLVRMDERGAWVVERYRGGSSRELGTFDDFADADARVRELMAPVPF